MTDAILKRIVRSRQARNAFRASYGHIADLCKQSQLTERMLLELDAIAAELCNELERVRYIHGTSAGNLTINKYKEFTK